MVYVICKNFINLINMGLILQYSLHVSPCFWSGIEADTVGHSYVCGEARTTAHIQIVTKIGQKMVFLFCGKFWVVHPVLDGETSGKTEQFVSCFLFFFFFFFRKCGLSAAGGCLACWPAAWLAGRRAGKKPGRLASWLGSRECLPTWLWAGFEQNKHVFKEYFFVLLNQHFYQNVVDQL